MDKRIREMLERQAEWQRGRAALAWEEKLRLSLVMRQAQLWLRGSAGKKHSGK